MKGKENGYLIGKNRLADNDKGEGMNYYLKSESVCALTAEPGRKKVLSSW